MKKTEKIYTVLQRKTRSLEEMKQDIIDWLSFLRIMTTIENYCFDNEEVQAFNLALITKRIQGCTEKEDLWIKIKGQGGESQLHISELTLHDRTILDKDLFFAYQTMIEDYLDTRMVKNGIYGYIRSLDEYLYNNVEMIEKRTFEMQEEIEKLPKRYNRNKEVIVDCNQLAGYDIFFKGLCLTSCWKMYYSDLFFQIIPKPIFLEVQQVQSITELANNVLKITLFNDPFNWELSVNQKYQRLFRDQMGYDQLAWNNGTGVLRPPYIEYAFVEDVTQTVQYQNHYYQPVEKKDATYFVTRSYDGVHHKYVENRTKGILNAQAYFPWIDEKSRKMMNYRVLNPQMALDGGLSAYEFYIRQFLEINVLDQKYDEFVSVLRFYLPQEAIKEVPLEALWDKLIDVNISNLKQKERSTRFDLQKAKNHLRVVFLDYSYLESVNQTIDISE
ncbi:hypothetical protein JZO66_08195 [Enterococcus sp. DIV0242_7C1]|uniref:Uncharacterized protein n=1 Tax=Candidatus Enterococcus dunnyi TaxID=1834192 RepID=A0A200JDA8_9ENTE|nr:MULTISPECIES: hypothetical protein [unclassified Enterococcus]MBO0470524.1 hypothetical protein [Enterococcus sp. DIV0242_7C1]OUZ34819.1 hypothetical protein A5889_000294 [Enterococcus sp. 9D6_DIV0238]